MFLSKLPRALALACGHMIRRHALAICRSICLTLLLCGAPNPAFATGCTSPTGNAGDQNYNTSINVMQFCNGTNWVNMGTVSGIGTLTAGDYCTTDGTLVNCTSSSTTVSSVYDLAVFYPGVPSASSIIRVVSARPATYAASLTGSYCVAREGATNSTNITINKIHSGTSTSVGTVTFAASGGTNQTCTFSSSTGISLSPGDVVEFVFPASPDASLGDIAITLAGTHT
jgi:hypothetical protein